MNGACLFLRSAFVGTLLNFAADIPPADSFGPPARCLLPVFREIMPAPERLRVAGQVCKAAPKARFT